MVRTAPAKVVVIDDDEVARESARVLLERWGYKVWLASDGESGVSAIKSVAPDLALVDLQMPGISGLEVLGQVREFDPTIICIMITGYATLQSAVSAMKEGAYDFLPKPFSPNELKLTVQRGLERRFLQLETKALREEKARMEANFVTLLTHQMRSPLAAVRQLLEVVVTQTLGPVPEAYTGLLDRATTRLDDLLATISAWLEMSKVAREGLIAERMSLMSQNRLLADLAKRSAVDAEAARQSLVVEADEHEAFVEADVETLLEALYNIVSNAVKYNRDGGRVIIVSRVGEDWIDVEVADQGPGIPEAEIPFIFDDFFRSKSEELKTKPGTGLGLSIAQRVVRAHNGQITVKSKPGEGTTFTVSLPRAKNN